MGQAFTRRRFLQSSTAGVASGALLAGTAGAADAPASVAPGDDAPQPKQDPLRFGYIGTGIRYHGLVHDGCQFGPCLAVCDVDAVQRGRALESANRNNGRHGRVIVDHYEDYRDLLKRDDVDVVVIATPDHWHTKIAIDAMRAGKDVYCEKPLTLTIREGQHLLKVAEETGKLLFVGTQQRTECDRLFPRAAAIVRDGRIGEVRRVTCAIGGSPGAVPVPVATPPKHFNWDMWLGQAPLTPYRVMDKPAAEGGYGSEFPYGRGHAHFRWWYEYSGGKLTDWGAHHVDIALWTLGKNSGPYGVVDVDPLRVEHPVKLDECGMPTQDDRFNTATSFHVRCTLADGVVLEVRDEAYDMGFDNGIMFEGDKGRIFVNRGKLTGAAVDELATNPLPEDALRKLMGKEPPASHMADFVQCVRTRETPVSDAASHHRTISLCHAVNVALRLGRKVQFDTAAETFGSDAVANAFVDRPQRSAYAIQS
ncbi:MAG: Gfo/Idh/MocA family oxidoreductase [Pirellulales bacterium]|nr:Gfo/Idh/MocA family oxidoreductase [Pirellulales bacterium]